MNRHDDLRLLLAAFGPQEKKKLFGKEALSGYPLQAQHLRLLCNEPYLNAIEAARRLHLTIKQYNICCTKTYDYVLQVSLKHRVAVDIEQQVQQLQRLAEAQKESGLFAEAQKTILKALKPAQQYELHGNEIALQYLLHQLSFFLPAQTGKETAASCLERIRHLVPQQAKTAQFRILYQQLLLLRYKYALCILPAEQQELATRVQQLQGLVPKAEDSATAHIYFRQAQLLICFMLGHTDTIIDHNEALLQCWQQHAHLALLHPELFIRSAVVQAYTHFLAKDVARVTAFLKHYEQLADTFLKVPCYQQWFRVIRFHTNLKVLHKTYQYEQLASYFSEQWASVYRMLPVLPRPEKIDILLSACITFFTLQQWAEAEALILHIKEENRHLKRSDTLYFTFVFHCLILYEQREWRRLHTLIDSEYHFLYRNKALRPFEHDMLLFIKKLPLITISANRKRTLKLFLQKLDSYKQHPVHRLYFAYFDFYSWVESKTEGMSYMDLVRRKAA